MHFVGTRHSFLTHGRNCIQNSSDFAQPADSAAQHDNRYAHSAAGMRNFAQ